MQVHEHRTQMDLTSVAAGVRLWIFTGDTILYMEQILLKLTVVKIKLQT